MKHNFSEFNASVNLPLIPVVLLHGWEGSLNSLNPLAEELSHKLPFRIINLELPGFGKTDLPKEIMCTEDYADFITDFLNDQGIAKTILVGHSFGGKTAICFTLNHPDKVDQLILINSSGIKPNNSTKKFFFKTLAAFAPKKLKQSGFLRRLFYKKIVRENDYLNASNLKASLSKIVEEHFDERLQAIDLRTLIIWSQKDSYVPLWMGELIKSKIRNSKLEVIENETHGLPLKKPELVADIISKFLKDT
jgi:pimeloyl-ACP methyl ester carboxylesterase